MIERSYALTLRARSLAERTLENLAFQDWVALIFHAYMWARVSVAPESPNATIARLSACGLFFLILGIIVAARGEAIANVRMRTLIYRVGIFGSMLLSYFELRYLLPALQPELYDAALYEIDRMLIGTTPALWFSQFNQRAIVEWFSFFYYSYFYWLGFLLIPALLIGRKRRLSELMAGAIVICAVGHFFYTVIPGAGPVAALSFDAPLQGGFWWRQVDTAVATAGAQLDIFPSLHTAYPTFFALHAYAHRDHKVFRWLWPIIAFFAVNIVIATMFLRWHWMIDIFAGLVLAFSARRIAMVVAKHESARDRKDDRRQPIWEPLWR